MNKKILHSAILVSLLSLTGCNSLNTPHFSYAGHTGADHWYGLSDTWKTCENGIKLTPVKKGSLHQSPVDFNSAIAVDPDFALDYNKKLEFKMLNNGHSIKFDAVGTDAATITIANKVYTLKQFHFHSLSEHTVKGNHAVMEGHFVNVAKDGSIAVLGVFINQSNSKGNSELEKAFSLDMPSSGEMNARTVMLNPSNILPDGKVYNYSGSLTTPPCTEGVAWNVYSTAISLSKVKVDSFKSKYNHNYRPVTGTY